MLYKAEAAATVEYTYETDSLLGAKQFEACIAVMKNMKARRQQQPEVMGKHRQLR